MAGKKGANPIKIQQPSNQKTQMQDFEVNAIEISKALAKIDEEIKRIKEMRRQMRISAFERHEEASGQSQAVESDEGDESLDYETELDLSDEEAECTRKKKKVE